MQPARPDGNIRRGRDSPGTVWRNYGYQQVYGKSPGGHRRGTDHRGGHGPSGDGRRTSGAGLGAAGKGHCPPYSGTYGHPAQGSGRGPGNLAAQAALGFRRRHGPHQDHDHPASGQDSGRSPERGPADEGRIRQRGPSFCRADRSGAFLAPGPGVQGIQHHPRGLRQSHGRAARRRARDQRQSRGHLRGSEQICARRARARWTRSSAATRKSAG